MFNHLTSLITCSTLQWKHFQIIYKSINSPFDHISSNRLTVSVICAGSTFHSPFFSFPSSSISPAPSRVKMMPVCEFTPTAVTSILPEPSITWVPAQPAEKQPLQHTAAAQRRTSFTLSAYISESYWRKIAKTVFSGWTWSGLRLLFVCFEFNLMCFEHWSKTNKRKKASKQNHQRNKVKTSKQQQQ